MKILSASQIRSADSYTILNEPVSSLGLMERAAAACVKWILSNTDRHLPYMIFCGPGNNGGDGLAIARMLLNEGLKVSVFKVGTPDKYSIDFLENEKRLRDSFPDVLREIKSEDSFPFIDSNDCVIDSIFGTGLSKPVEGLYLLLIRHINASRARVRSIDMPSGLFADCHTPADAIVHAKDTLSFQLPKLAFMFAENARYVGDFHIMDIGLDHRFIDDVPAVNHFVTDEMIHEFLKPRNKFSHKGNYGHALLVAGGEGKMGAALLAAEGCLRTGVGLLTVQIPASGNVIMHTANPEAMIATGEIDFDKYGACGIGPGLGMEEEASNCVRRFLHEAKFPLVLDADALNIISSEKELINRIPVHSIITPHQKEFERMVGKSGNDFDKHDAQVQLSKNHKIYIVLKGAHSCLTTPEGKSYFNSTGNAGMAKGGSGDVLTGMITSLLAQGYSPFEASLLGVYLHGLAGDIAASEFGADGMIATDLVNAIPAAWLRLRKVS